MNPSKKLLRIIAILLIIMIAIIGLSSCDSPSQTNGKVTIERVKVSTRDNNIYYKYYMKDTEYNYNGFYFESKNSYFVSDTFTLITLKELRELKKQAKNETN